MESDEHQTMFGNEKKSVGRRLQHRWTVASWWTRVLYILLLLILLAVFVILILVIVVLIKAAVITTPAFALNIFDKPAPGIEDGLKRERAERLAGAIRLNTVSNDVSEGENTIKNKFVQVHQYLRQHFPTVHEAPFITREVVNKHSLLYTVTGENNGDALPYLLASHLDVVPADPATWEYDPFGGEIVNDTFIYGRGAFDDKGGIMGMMEALEYKLKNGDRPQRTFFIAFGHDEEITGQYGAGQIAETLRSRGVDKLDFVLDEGYFVTRGIVPGATTDVALLGVAEKGSVTLELTVTQFASHSSFPPWETAIGILSEAVSKVEKNKLPSMLGTGPERYTLEYVAPYVDFGMRMIYANLWLFADIVASVMQSDPLLNTIVRTTTALTIINGGVKDNVVPASATAVVNHRIHPSQTVDDVIEFDRNIMNDPRVKIKIRDAREAHPISPFGPEDVHYHMVAASIAQTFLNTPVVPGLLIANTDTYWYLGFTKNVFRFFPTILDPEDTLRFHGDNERISIDIYDQSVNFYYRIFHNADVMIDHALTK